MKTIIAVSNGGRTGKTESIKEFTSILTSTYTYTLIHPTIPNVAPDGDTRLVLKVNRKIIGIEPQGDPNTDLDNRLKELIDTYNCDIIICSCRSRGDTKYDVHDAAKKGYNIIWTKSYETQDRALRHTLNRLKGRHILEILINLECI